MAVTIGKLPAFGRNKQGQQGKWSEEKVRDFYEAQARTNIQFAYYRYPDVRAGTRTTAPCDFQGMLAGQMFVWEIKETKELHRLPHMNFTSDKMARARKWVLAGAVGKVIICHTELVGGGAGWKTRTGWRMLNLMDLAVPPKKENGENSTGSWDLRAYPYVTFDQIEKYMLSTENPR